MKYKGTTFFPGHRSKGGQLVEQTKTKKYQNLKSTQNRDYKPIFLHWLSDSGTFPKAQDLLFFFNDSNGEKAKQLQMLVEVYSL